MGIRFPKLHIAESVTNRILNVVDDLRGQGMIDVPSLPQQPEVPRNTTEQGAAIEAGAMATPPQLAAPASAPQLSGAIARGEDLIEGA